MILALDLEATLVISAHWPWSRPGLREFLDWAGESFNQVVVYTAVDEPLFRSVASFLVSRKEAPQWFETCAHYRAHEYPDEEWSEDLEEIMCKDLYKVVDDLDKIVIVDDHVDYILPSQRDRLVSISPYDGDPKDRALEAVRHNLISALKR